MTYKKILFHVSLFLILITLILFDFLNLGHIPIERRFGPLDIMLFSITSPYLTVYLTIIISASLHSLVLNKVTKSISLFVTILGSITIPIFFVIIFYKRIRGVDLNLNLLRFNTDTLTTGFLTAVSFWYFLLILGLLVLLFWIIRNIETLKSEMSYKKISVITALLAFSAVISYLSFSIKYYSYPSSINSFIYSNIKKETPVTKRYEVLYSDYITDRAKTPLIINSNNIKDAEDKLGNKVIILQLESLNSYLVTDKITPNLYESSTKGYLNKYFRGNSIQSIRGIESILCGVPPALKESLVNTYSKETLSNLNCLPSIFNKLGYKSAYFLSYDYLDFNNIGPFTKAIGFNNVYAGDIMKDKAEPSEWGYREDNYLEEVERLLTTQYKDEKTFVYIELGATNHTPFTQYNSFEDKDKLPYPNPKTFKEQVANTTFMQDFYIKPFLDFYFKELHESTTLIMLGDHSYPIGLIENNTSNEANAYEENFMSSMVYIPAKNKNVVKIDDKKIYEQSDIRDSLLDVIGLNDSDAIGKPFTNSTTQKEENLSIQPYDKQFITIITPTKKYSYNTLDDATLMYDLHDDKRENIESVQIVPNETFINLMDKYFGRN